MKKIGIIYKTEDELIAGTAQKVAAELKADGYKVFLDEKRLKEVDYIITMGGDGTILRASKISSKLKIPILPIHLGGLGIMSEIPLEGLSQALSAIKSKEFQLESRMMLEVEVVIHARKGKQLKKGLALNDIVIGKNEIARTIKLEAYVKGKLIANYVGDGLIISTPTGSTAYNFAVQGPILPTDSLSFILSPICPHRAANRSIVLHDEVTVKLIKGQNILLTIDGQDKISLHEGDFVSTKPSKSVTTFIRLKEYDLWALLRERMGWG